MALPANLSLIPYPLDNYQLQPIRRQNTLPGQEPGQPARQAYDLVHRPKLTKRFNHTDGPNSTYNAGYGMESSKLDYVGSLVDIYI